MHEMGSGHPECPERLDAISDQLLASGLINYLQSTQAQAPATLQALKRVHLGDYLDRLSAQSPIEGYREIDADTSMNRH